MRPAVEFLSKKLAKPFESLYLDAYWDPHPDGFPTQGYGRLLSRYSLKKHLSEGKTLKQANDWLKQTYPRITEYTAEEWLTEDLEKTNKAVKRLVKVYINPFQEAALTDFAFNVGAGNLQASTLLRLLNRSDYLGAANEFPKWKFAGGKILNGLVRRRTAEKEMFSY
jgi:GH24 family phage-related lysozyme (muramidase)